VENSHQAVGLEQAWTATQKRSTVRRLTFFAVKTLTARVRGKLAISNDFDMDEELRRITACSTLLTVKAFGLNWFQVYKEYCTLGGSIAADLGLWLVDRRSDSKEGNKRKQ
jgi:hypothetical protein